MKTELKPYEWFSQKYCILSSATLVIVFFYWNELLYLTLIDSVILKIYYL